MKKVISGLVAIAVAVVIAHAPAYAEMNKVTAPKQVKLSGRQKAELSKLYKEKAAIEKKILNKYVEFGVLTKDIARKIEAHKAEWLKKLEESGFNMNGKVRIHHHGGGEHSHPKF